MFQSIGFNKNQKILCGISVYCVAKIQEEEGKLTHRDYKDAKGEKHYITEVVVNEILILKYRDQQSAREAV